MTVYLNENGNIVQKSTVGEVIKHLGAPEGPTDAGSGMGTGTGWSFLSQAMTFPLKNATLVISAARWYTPPGFEDRCAFIRDFETAKSKNCYLGEWSPIKALTRSSGLSDESKLDSDTKASFAIISFRGQVELQPQEFPALFTFNGEPSYRNIQLLNDENIATYLGKNVSISKVVLTPTTEKVSSDIVRYFPFASSEFPMNEAKNPQIPIFPPRLFYTRDMAKVVGGDAQY